MGADPKAVDDALATLQRTLDRLTLSGQDEPAFEIARAQFSASIRASWPANLSGVARTVDSALQNSNVSLTDEEREELAKAVAVLRSVPHD